MTEFYVDFSAVNNGNGTDGAQAGAPAGVGAFNQFTAGEAAGVSDGDVVYFRRTASADTKSVSFKMGTGPKPSEKIHYLGWPINNTDKHHAQAQASSNTVKATWDADPELFVVINPVAAAWTPEFIRVARMHGEELGGGVNHFMNHTTGTPQDYTFYKCKVSRNAQQPTLQPANGADGVIEYDDVHVKGTTPGAIRCIGDSNNGSVLLRVRIEFTDVGSSSIDITSTNSAPKSGIYEILEWIDAGNHWIYAFFGLGQGSQQFKFTTDDDAVGVLPFEPRVDCMSISSNVIIRNLTLNHAFGTISATPLLTPTAGNHNHAENFEFHPTAHTNQIDVNNAGGKLTGRNIKNFDASKVNVTNIVSSKDVGPKRFVHFAQINNTEAWYRIDTGAIAQISSVNRTGGAANAILVEMLDRPVELQNRGHCNGIFFSEFKGIEAFAFVKTGLGYPASQTLTAYFAVANWDGIEDSDRIWFEIELYKNAGANDYARRLIDSRKLPLSQSFIADASVWNGLIGHNAYRAEIPVTIEKDDIVKVRFFIRDTHLSIGLQRNLVVFDPAMTMA